MSTVFGILAIISFLSGHWVWGLLWAFVWWFERPKGIDKSDKK